MRLSALIGCLLLGACDFEVDGLSLVAATDGGAAGVADLGAPLDMTVPSGAPDLGDNDDLLAPDLLEPPDLSQPDLAPPVDLSQPDLSQPDLLPLEALLSGRRDSFSGTIDLTSEGVLDWEHWGLNGVGHDRKQVGSTEVNLLAGFVVYSGASSVDSYGDYPVGFSWTDGSPTATATGTTTGLVSRGEGSGFQVTAPADTTTRVLVVYVRYGSALPAFKAELSDSAAPAYTDTPVASAVNMWGNLKYTITYRTTTANQKLTASWTLADDQYPGGGGSVSLFAATLR